jgi:hypothetical protein
MFLFLIFQSNNQYQLLLQINMEGMKDLIEDEIKLHEDSIDQLSSTVWVEQGELKIEEDPNDHPFCVAVVAQEEVVEHPSDQRSSAVYVKQEEVKNEENPYDQLPSAACIKHNDEEERYNVK